MTTTLDLPAMPAGPLQAEVSLLGRTIRLRLAGNADMRVTYSLHLFLTRLHAEARRHAVAEVEVDLHSLEFMNSSCFKNFVTWINEVGESVKEQQYKIRFVSNPSLLWQRRSLHALCGFAKDLITVEGRTE